MLNRMALMMDKMPVGVRKRVEPILEVVDMLSAIQNNSVMAGFLPSFTRGFVFKLGDLPTSSMVSGHPAHFDWRYKSDFPEMRDLYSRAKQNQWDGEVDLDWSIDVDPRSPDIRIIPDAFISLDRAAEFGVHLNTKEKRALLHDVASWMLSQFLHGEQGALYAAAQVTESVEWVDGKLYGATQVVDEGRHVEVFHRYIDEKLEKLYIINDNLFTIIDALISDSRWDMKFLGMQIMVEGLALGAFGMLYKWTEEPLLKNLLRYVIRDEARHVHYGVLALKEHITTALSETERREREDWVFEVSLLMQNRFMMYEVYEEWFEHKLSRRQWRELVLDMPGLHEFRQVMFSRLVPNLKTIGLLSDRMLPHYDAAGLLKYMHGADALSMSGDTFLQDLDHAREAELAAAE
ncbi:MAG: ferritin-like domain-containing protein [bacterium]